MTHTRLTIEPLPTWLDAARLLGSGAQQRGASFRLEPLGPAHSRLHVEVVASEAADIAARLRGIAIDGRPLQLTAEPPLSRALVRAARLRDARARRNTTPGFTRTGALASGEGRYSLTPEALASALGREARGAHVLDACCGSGGNSIGFARAGSRVDAIELDRPRLGEAQHNARLYGVAERISFIHGDARELVATRAADLLFIDPPWGEQYDKRCTSAQSFPLLAALLALDLARFAEVWLKVPSSFRSDSIPGARPSAWFGTAPGDSQRIKFLLLRCPGTAFPRAMS